MFHDVELVNIYLKISIFVFNNLDEVRRNFKYSAICHIGQFWKLMGKNIYQMITLKRFIFGNMSDITIDTNYSAEVRAHDNISWQHA